MSDATFVIENNIVEYSIEDQAGDSIVFQESVYRGAIQGPQGPPGTGGGGGATRCGGIAVRIEDETSLLLYNNRGEVVPTDVTALTNSTFLLSDDGTLVDTSFHTFTNLRDAPDGAYMSDGSQIDDSNNVVCVMAQSLASIAVIGLQADNLYDRTYQAHEDLSGHTWVTLDDTGTLIAASADVSGHAGRVVGITTGAILNGLSGPVRPTGEIYDGSFNFDPSLPIWLGLNGASTQTPPDTADGYVFSQIVAWPIVAQAIEINLNTDPIILT